MENSDIFKKLNEVNVIASVAKQSDSNYQLFQLGLI